MPKREAIKPELHERALAHCAAKFEVAAEEVCSCIPRPVLVEARSLYVWLVHYYQPNVGYSAIGRALGGRKCSTVANLHLLAVTARLRDRSFENLCEDFCATERSLGNIYACA